MIPSKTRSLSFALLALAGSLLPLAHAGRITVTVQAGDAGKPISPDLFGIFFEDLNYAADGGLYAELIQNRSFEYQATEQPTWTPLAGWDVVTRGAGKGALLVEDSDPVHPNNPHYAVLQITEPGDGVGVANAGFDGIRIEAGESYDVSLFARQLYTGNRWGSKGGRPASGPLLARLESASGEVLGAASLGTPPLDDWQRLTATITARKSDDAARLVVQSNVKGAVALDVISMFPQKTFRQRANGLRADLAQVIADLHPKFVRFPGGCLVHGDGLGNMYRWKDTVGPIEQRREQSNLWSYHQSVGLGYFEYFQFCEDIGAKPLPVVPAAVCCQNSNHTAGTGQKGLPLEAMPAYIQDVLDLIEYANGPATSKWGALRAAAGHPEPFHLQYLGVGNEDHITPVFKERFQLIYEAVKAKHPEITVIGTVGPAPSGPDFDAGWKIADELHLPMVDEHYYEKPEWFLQNLNRYDSYDRAKSKVYVGEYASRGNTLFNAIAEAAYMTGLERNGDVVHLASYAPLLAKLGHTQWNPDLIYFSNGAVTPTINYYAQQLFSTNSGDVYLPNSLSESTKPNALAVSSVRDSKSGDVIVKFVNATAQPQSYRLELAGRPNVLPPVRKTVLTGSPEAVNRPGEANPVTPKTTTLATAAAFDDEAPPFSLTVLRMKTRAGN